VDLFDGDVVGADMDPGGRWDLILAGDVCYEAPMTGHILPWLRGLAAAGAEVWIADPGRAYVPRDGMEEVARYEVPTTRELEDRDSRVVRVLRVTG
jgi:predicted nicotinamide N-methyase